MKDSDKMDAHEREDDDDVQLYDPFAHHFISQNHKNDFLKSLEEGHAEPAYSIIH